MYNILICDDDKDIVNALKLYLADPNYQMFEAFTGQEALDIMEAQDIHLILMDIMMPEMDGISAMTKIQRPRHPPHRQERGHRQNPGAERRGRRLHYQTL